MPTLTMPRLPQVDLSALRMPTLPHVTLPSFDLPTMDLTSLDLGAIADKVGAQISALDDTVTEAAKDALYISIGLGVLAIQQAQVRRRELVAELGDRLDASRETVEHLLGAAESRVRSLTSRAS